MPVAAEALVTRVFGETPAAPTALPIQPVIHYWTNRVAKDDLALRKLVRSCILSSLLLGATISLSISSFTGIAERIPYFFWIPLALGYLGVAGSNYLNLRQRWHR